jgi:outer membrane protein OmpA-like peptidoglycan-associated protein
MVAHRARIALLVLGVLTVLGACGGSQRPEEKPGRTVISEGSIEILDPISFTGEAELAPSSHPALDAIASTLDGNPSIKLVEVRAHVADGDEAARQQIADRRAQVVVDYLIGRKVAAARLRARGVTQPSAKPDETVELHILERDTQRE